MAIKNIKNSQGGYMKNKNIITESFTSTKFNKATEAVKFDGIEVVFENDKAIVYHPKTRDEAIQIGMDTRWAISAPGEYNFFEKFNKRGPIFVVIAKDSDRKYGVHLASGNIADAHDRLVPLKTLLDMFDLPEEIFKSVSGAPVESKKVKGKSVKEASFPKITKVKLSKERFEQIKARHLEKEKALITQEAALLKQLKQQKFKERKIKELKAKQSAMKTKVDITNEATKLERLDPKFLNLKKKK